MPAQSITHPPLRRHAQANKAAGAVSHVVCTECDGVPDCHIWKPAMTDVSPWHKGPSRPSERERESEGEG